MVIADICPSQKKQIWPESLFQSAQKVKPHTPLSEMDSFKAKSLKVREGDSWSQLLRASIKVWKLGPEDSNLHILPYCKCSTVLKNNSHANLK